MHAMAVGGAVYDSEKGESWNVLGQLCRGNTESDAQSSPPNVRIGWQSRQPDRLGGDGTIRNEKPRRRENRTCAERAGSRIRQSCPTPVYPDGSSEPALSTRFAVWRAPLIDVPHENSAPQCEILRIRKQEVRKQNVILAASQTGLHPFMHSSSNQFCC